MGWWWQQQHQRRGLPGLPAAALVLLLLLGLLCVEGARPRPQQHLVGAVAGSSRHSHANGGSVLAWHGNGAQLSFLPAGEPVPAGAFIAASGSFLDSS